MFVNKLFTSHVRMSERYFNVKPSTYYFHLERKILEDFQICFSVPLNILSARFCHKNKVHLVEYIENNYLLVNNLFEFAV